MPQFNYRARNAQGALVEGVLDCADRAVAIRQIEQQRCIPIKIDIVGAAPQTVATGKAVVAKRARLARSFETAPVDAEPEDSTRTIAHLYRATGQFAASGNDAR